MDLEVYSYSNYDRYGMPLCPHVKILESGEDEDEDKSSSLSIRSAEASALRKQGKFGEALKILDVILKEKIVTLGHDHKDTCATRNSMAYLHLKRKECDKAYKLHYQIKSAFIDRCNLIHELYHEGEYEKALRFTQRIYDQIKRISHPRDPEGLKIRALSANICATMNKYKEALRLYEDVYQKYFHKDGPDHPDTLTIQRKIGLVLQDLGKLDEALDTFKDVLKKRLKKLGHEHEDTLVSHKDLAQLLCELGKHNKALDIYRDVYEIQKQMLPEHPATLATRCEIAKLLSTKRRYNDALDILSEVYDIQRSNRRYLDIRATMNFAAQVLVDMGNARSALRVYLRLYETQKNPNHPDTLNIEKNIASVLVELGRYDDAREILNSLYLKFSEIFGYEHTKTLETQTNVAKILALLGEFDQALKIFNIIYDIQEKREFLGPDHPQTLHTDLNIADVYAEQEKYEEALDIYREVLEKRLLVLDADTAEILKIECDIAGVYRSQTQYNKSFQAYYKVYEKRTRVLGDIHPDTLEVERIMDVISHEMPSPMIVFAAHQNDLKMVKVCAEEGHDLNARDTDGSVALHLASKQGHVEIIEYLLGKGAIYNARNREGKKPVDVAEIDDVKRLFNAVEALLKTIKSGSYPLVVRFVEVEKASINARDTSGCTPLHWAVSMGCKRTVTFLLENGANFTFVTKNGNTALHLATSRCFKDVAETLLRFVKEKQPGILKIFINAKTNVFGTTCLHSAAQHNHYAIVKLLLQYGANTRIKNKLGKLPVDLTTQYDIRTMLIAYEASFY